jgi:cytosine/creatinine deaminase
MALTITDVLLADGTRTSVRIVDGIVHAHGMTAEPGDARLAGNGRLLLPAMAEAHAHLDKAFLAETVPNPTGDLMGAILGVEAARDRITFADTAARAERAARLIAANGATVIRTHADLTEANGLMSVAALLHVRELLRELVEIEVFLLSGSPSIGPAGATQRSLITEAIAMGVDGIGGCPHLETDPAAANETFLTIAAGAGLPLDLHTDETLDPTRFALADLAERVTASGFPHRVTASHCVSLGMQPTAVQQSVAEQVAAAGIHVVALPSSNLFLQGRDHQTGMPRGLTAVRALRSTGVNVAAGADNLQDPFNPVGRGDCLETAALMVMAGHVLPPDAYDMVSNNVRDMMGLAAAGPRLGQVADLVLLPAHTVREAIAFAPANRTVIRNGVVVGGPER